MKYLFAAVMLASAVVGFSEAASAAGGCGPGWYRGAYGGCRPMYNCPPGWHSGPFGRHCFRNW